VVVAGESGRWREVLVPVPVVLDTSRHNTHRLCDIDQVEYIDGWTEEQRLVHIQSRQKRQRQTTCPLFSDYPAYVSWHRDFAFTLQIASSIRIVIVRDNRRIKYGQEDETGREAMPDVQPHP
jgi:hypothetical protein